MAKKNISELIKENSEKDVSNMKQVQEPEPKEKKSSVISTVAPVALIKQLDSRAVLLGRTRADLILEACNEYVRQNPISEDMIKDFLATANAE